MTLEDDAPEYGCGIHEDVPLPCVHCAEVLALIARDCTDDILRRSKLPGARFARHRSRKAAGPRQREWNHMTSSRYPSAAGAK